ncbi:diversity-generating retroelement protein Avd [Dolichospermum heterosporum]|uniref:Diversity-generating retroelement protein Avd n=1 Tax=Dolichospermum heterosporum TAC447 TaxID=747523 RepID=A0ABY5LWA9_9CYAN|nr:diversity-generating retroelement protein Avd [Dolichospermum heterosporum]UUO16252.1 diversity-generating retroelement protein Avd [Dolichospermum heterosporum TAC447]
MGDLPIIQKTYDLINWYVPIINRLPRNHKFMLGNRITTVLYDILDELLIARYRSPKLTELRSSNIKLEILRYQTRLLFDFHLISTDRYEYIQKLINEIGLDLGGWIKQQENLTLNNL